MIEPENTIEPKTTCVKDCLGLIMMIYGLGIFLLNLFSGDWYNNSNTKIIWIQFSIIANGITYFIFFLIGFLICAGTFPPPFERVYSNPNYLCNTKNIFIKTILSLGIPTFIFGFISLVIGYSFDVTKEYDAHDHYRTRIIGWSGVSLLSIFSVIIVLKYWYYILMMIFRRYFPSFLVSTNNENHTLTVVQEHCVQDENNIV